MATTFLDCVNRIFQSNAIIRGDTDTITTFSDTQHNASIGVARVAVQNELIDLISNRLIPRERKTTGSITFGTQSRVYSLPTDFIRWYGVPHLYSTSQNRQIYEYNGGLEQLQIDIFNYATQYGNPNWFYEEPATLKSIGFFQVPSASENGNVWTFDYEGSVLVTVSSDSLPFQNTEEEYCFTNMASRRFKFMFEDVKNKADITNILINDTSYKTAKAALINLIKGKNSTKYYSSVYR